MPNRDHNEIVIGQVNGLYNRSMFEEATPPDHLNQAENIVYGESGWRTRNGTRSIHNVGSIRRFFHYNRLNEVPRLLILNETGQLYDSTNLGFPILNIPAMKDFSVAQFFDNIFITPHDRNTGLENEFVHIYDGTTCRVAGSDAPSGSLTVSNSLDSGHVEKGTHLFAIAFETESGFISKPGPALYGVVQADGEHKVKIEGIPIGPPGTIARRILTTRLIPEYDGNQEGYVFYFIPTGRLEDNISSEMTVDFYDADLLQEADYLFDQLDKIPAGVGITTYQNSLVVWGEYNDPSTIRLSKQGEPESFNAIEGLMQVAPNEAGGLKNAIEFRDSLYMMKSNRTYSTSRDLVNPESPIFWRIISIDEGIGTECFGVANILDTLGPNTDNFALASHSGIYMFNGVYQQPEFSWKIDQLWHDIDRSRFDEIQVYNDVVQNLLYIFLPDETIHVADYRNGLTFQAVRWSRWTFPWKVTAISINVQEDRESRLLIAGDGQIWEMDEFSVNDGVIRIHTEVKYAPQTPDGGNGYVNQFSSVRVRCRGVGKLDMYMYGTDDVQVFPIRPIDLKVTAGQEFTRLTNLRSERCSLYMELTAGGEYVEVQKVVLFTDALWLERPSGYP